MGKETEERNVFKVDDIQFMIFKINFQKYDADI